MTERKTITTKSGAEISESWCRKCACMKPASDFYEAVDLGRIDTLMIMSVCKNCINKLYDEFYDETGSIEKSIHKLCISLNVKYSNDAASATRTNIDTLRESGKTIRNVFGIYKTKLIATKKSMDKSEDIDMTYQDVGTIYVAESEDIKEVPIPKEVINFWGADLTREQIIFLEDNYRKFKETHEANTYAQIVLLKEVCYTMLTIQELRREGEDTQKSVKELQEIMKNLAISPNVKNNGYSEDTNDKSFGEWIQDIEKYEPAQWLMSDPRGDMYRDVANVEEYFQKYIVRPLKNFIAGSKDFNINEEDENIDEWDDADNLFSDVDDEGE